MPKCNIINTPKNHTAMLGYFQSFFNHDNNSNNNNAVIIILMPTLCYIVYHLLYIPSILAWQFTIDQTRIFTRDSHVCMLFLS